MQSRLDSSEADYLTMQRKCRALERECACQEAVWKEQQQKEQQEAERSQKSSSKKAERDKKVCAV